jgi:predicted Holliday junction resolvase-like endonuclease
MVIYIVLFITLANLAAIYWFAYSRANALKSLKDMEKEFTTLLSHKKSSEVRLGQISEQLAPFLDLFPFDPKKVQFLGNPIDYIYFGEDKIVIIEVKSGNARLSKKQKHIKSLVLGGKVFWDEIRIK